MMICARPVGYMNPSNAFSFFLPFSHLLVSSIVPLPPTLSGTIHPVLDLHPFSRTLVVGDGPHYCLPSAGYSLSRFLRAQCRLHASFILVLPPESRAPQRERGLFYLTHDLRLLGHNRPASERQGIDIKSPKFQLPLRRSGRQFK